MKHFPIALFIGLTALFLLSSCSLAEKTTATSLDSETLEQSSLEEIDGAQEVMLSWGKFNYNPETITVKAGRPVRITADLTRLRGCFQTFTIPDLGIQISFDAGSESFEFTPTEKGTFLFTCAMGMGKGTFIVE